MVHIFRILYDFVLGIDADDKLTRSTKWRCIMRKSVLLKNQIHIIFPIYRKLATMDNFSSKNVKNRKSNDNWYYSRIIKKYWKWNVHFILKLVLFLIWSIRYYSIIIDKYNWLHTRMSYNRFPNVWELIQVDLVSKLQKGV